MRGDEEQLRIKAIKRYFKGETSFSIYKDLNRSKSWFFKWLNRYKQGTHQWYRERSRAPKSSSRALVAYTEDPIIRIRKTLESTKYAQIGAEAIAWELTKLDMTPPPVWTINRILKRKNLITKRIKSYQSKGRITLLLRLMPLISFTRQISLDHDTFTPRNAFIL